MIKRLTLFLLFALFFVSAYSLSVNDVNSQTSDDQLSSMNEKTLEKLAIQMIQERFGENINLSFEVLSIQRAELAGHVFLRVTQHDDVLGSLTEDIHTYAIYDYEGKLEAIFREPSDEYYLYADRIPETLLPKERYQQWLDIRNQERQIQVPGAEHKLPFTGGLSFIITRGGNVTGGSPSHENKYDFAMPVGTDVRATRGGTVVDVQEGLNFNCYPPNPPCSNNNYKAGNYVRVLHSDGTYGGYIHLKHQGVIVQNGDTVSQGTCLAESGNTGYSSGPHLHFSEGPDLWGNTANRITWVEAPSSNPHLDGSHFMSPSSQNATFVCGTSDETAPTTTHDFDDTLGNNGWYQSNVNVTLMADDNGGTGVATIHYYYDGLPDWQSHSGSLVSFTVSQEGATTISYYAVDNAGNTETTKNSTVRIDKSNPTSSCMASGSGSNGWYQGGVTVQCTGADSVSGLDTIWYAVDGGSQIAYNAPFAVSGEGEHTVAYYAEDVAGNEQPTQQLTVGIDDTPPAILTMTVNNGAITAYNVTALVSSVVTDNLSGVAEMCVSYNQFDWTCQPYVDEFVFALPVLVQSEIPVYLYVIDEAGNESAVVSDTIFLDPYPDLPVSTSYRLCSTAVTSAGGQRTSGSFQLADTVGEAHIEWLTSGNFQLQSGFMSRGTDCPLSPIPTVGYELVRTVIAASGETKTSPSFTLNSTFGEGMVQPCSIGDSFRLDAGFWSDCGAVLPTAVIPYTHRITDTHFITWTHLTNVDTYEVYRSETPYFTPETATMVAVVSAPQTGYSTTLGIGNVNTNYYYLVVSRKTGVVQTAVSHTVGEFDFNLVAGD